MKYILTILLMTPLTTLPQTVLTGKVSICKECKGVGMTVKNKDTGKDSYAIKTSKNKKGKLQTEILYAPYKLVQDNSIVASGITNSDGEFEIKNLKKGNYEIQININRFLKADTLIELREKRTKIEIELDDKYLWRHLDSTQLAKFPYNKEIAKRDIEKGDIKILSAGLQLLSDNDLDSMTTKYGFKYFPVAGCIIDSYQDKAMDDYNSVIYEYLNKLNGQEWRKNLGADIKTLYLSLRKKNDR
jgi:hypothetical protein